MRRRLAVGLVPAVALALTACGGRDIDQLNDELERANRAARTSTTSTAPSPCDDDPCERPSE